MPGVALVSGIARLGVCNSSINKSNNIIGILAMVIIAIIVIG